MFGRLAKRSLNKISFFINEEIPNFSFRSKVIIPILKGCLPAILNAVIHFLYGIVVFLITGRMLYTVFLSYKCVCNFERTQRAKNVFTPSWMGCYIYIQMRIIFEFTCY